MKLIILLTFLNFGLLFSQNIVCDPCSTIPETVDSVTITTYKSIQLPNYFCKVFFTKVICDGVYIIKIIEVRLLNQDSTINVSELIPEITKYILYNNPMQFPVNQENENIIWRFLKGSCWHYSDSSKTKLLPCGEACCVWEVLVREKCGKKNFTTVSFIEAICPEVINEPNSLCFHACYILI